LSLKLAEQTQSPTMPSSRHLICLNRSTQMMHLSALPVVW
jgi:hypothetical protein